MGEMSTSNTKRTIVGERMTICPRGKKQIHQAEFHHAGKHCRRSLKTTIKRVAMRRAAKLEQSLDMQVQVKDNEAQPPQTYSTTLKAATKEFLRFWETERKRRRTIVKRRGILNRFVDFAEKNGVRAMGGVDLRVVSIARSGRQKLVQHRWRTKASCANSFLDGVPNGT
jgi:hypothetical protein